LFSDGVKALIRDSPSEERPYVIIIEFTLVLGIDSSAVQAIVKLRDSLSNQFDIKLSIFVPGKSDGFPCENNLSELLDSRFRDSVDDEHQYHDDASRTKGDSEAGISGNTAMLTGSRVCDDLDQALSFAEDALIAMVNPDLLPLHLYNDNIKRSSLGDEGKQIRSLEEESTYAIELLHCRCLGEKGELVEQFFSYFSRESYNKGDILWKQGTRSDSAKLLVSGDLMSSLENEAGTIETISIGSIIGESGLVQNSNRNSTVHVLEDDTVLYSLSCEAWEEMKRKDPTVAHLLYAIVIQYLTLRVQHVSNRIFETRCLPI